MNAGGLEVAPKTSKAGVVHPEDRALQGCNSSAGWASEPAGAGGGDIAGQASLLDRAESGKSQRPRGTESPARGSTKACGQTTPRTAEKVR